MSLGLRRIEPMKLQYHHVGIRWRELPHHHVREKAGRKLQKKRKKRKRL
ncbi:unnamed protein product [Brassica oleracea var. botrytis]|uniref:Uncharacterized protein n=2 Tax=Brassica TaxID=3705 RepID=A0A3P6DR61_BRAOL|nr:unnamed protein product [Brassica napus]VDD24575.1 unnamed protein product [Brassica oleracea]